jgi:hypothetical protein
MSRTLGEKEFERYIRAFNADDFAGFGRYYTRDVEVQGQAARLRGRDALVSFYRRIKARVHMTLSVQDLVAGERALVADLVTQLEAMEDWPEFPTGALRKGEVRRSQNFVWYDLRDGRFARIRSARYRSGVEPAARPASLPITPGRSPGLTREAFTAYIEAFNRDDEHGFAAYYDPEVVLAIGGHLELRGIQAICDFYRDVKARTRRQIEVRNLICAGDRVAAELESEFLALQDLPDFAAGPMSRGGRLALHTLVLYELRNGRFVRIRSASLRKSYQSATG